MTSGSPDAVVQQSEEIDAGLFVLATLGRDADDHVLLRTSLPSGMFVPLHRHGDFECIHVLAGTLDVYLGDRGSWFTVAAGHSIVVQSEVAHAIRNVADHPADTLAVTTVRLASFLRGLGEIAAAAGHERTREERMRSLRELADRYGYWLASPAESEAIRALPAVPQ